MRPPVRRALIAAIGAGAIAIPVTIAGVAVAAEASSIADIQGAAHTSPLAGEQVSDIPGVVTAVSSKGLWIQSAQPDDDDATSDGVYVFTDAEPAAKVGDAVTISGTVTEYRPGGDESNLSTTEITDPTVTVTGQGELPEPVLVGPGGRKAPKKVHAKNPGDVEQADFNVRKNALDFYESMEGMLVRVADAAVVGPTTRNGEVAVLPGGGKGGVRTDRGGIKYTAKNANTQRVILDDVLSEEPIANVGDTLPGAVDGVLDYSFGNFKLQALATPEVESGGLEREVAKPQGDRLAVATYNVENLDPGDPAEAFERHGEYIATNLASPDIVGIEEMQDDNGPEDDGTVSADQGWRQLIDAIVAAGGPAYEYQSIDPEDKADGGEPGGNIRVGFLYNPDRVDPSDKEAGDATTAVTVGDDGLSVSPGRIAPADDAWADSRKPLAAEFTFEGEKIFVVVNHFASKGGDNPLMGRFQPPTRSSEEQRHPQAKLVNDFVKQLRDMDRKANVVVLGDINDFEFSETVDILTDGRVLKGGYDLLKEKDRYSYVFDGNSQVLDQILVSPHLARKAKLDVVHVNAEFTDQASDHDPSVITLRP